MFGGDKDISKNNPIKIGAILPLTGEQAFVGEGIKDSILLAKSKIKNTKYTYELIFEDSALNPKVAASAAQKLIDIDKVDVIISVYANIGNIVSPVVEKNKVVHFGIAFDPNIAKGEYNFIHWTPPSEMIPLFKKEILKRNINKLSILKLNHQGPESIYKELIHSLEGSNIKIVGTETIQPGTRDFKSSIVKLSQNKPDLYLLLVLPPELEIATREIKELGIIKPLSTIFYFELSPNKETFNNLWYIGSASPSDDFSQEYTEKYKKSVMPGAANAYDIFNMIVFSAENYAKNNNIFKLTTEDLVKELLKISSFDGVLGKLSINQEGIVLSKGELKIIKDGNSVKLEN